MHAGINNHSTFTRGRQGRGMVYNESFRESRDCAKSEMSVHQATDKYLMDKLAGEQKDRAGK